MFVKCFNFGSIFATSNIIFMNNKLELLLVPNFLIFEICFIFGTNFSVMRELILNLMFRCALLGSNFDFLVGYLVVTPCYLVVTAGYSSLPGGYCSLLVVTACYRSLLVVPTRLV